MIQELLDLLAYDVFTDAPEYAERVRRIRELLAEVSPAIPADNEAEQALRTVRTAQTYFWESLSDLENITGKSLDSNQDFRDQDLSTLREE
jgi:hypothetical protein